MLNITIFLVKKKKLQVTSQPYVHVVEPGPSGNMSTRRKKMRHGYLLGGRIRRGYWRVSLQKGPVTLSTLSIQSFSI